MGRTLEEKLLKLTSSWWFYLLLVILFFLPAYASKGYSPEDTSKLIEAVLSQPFIYTYPAIFFIFKLLPFVSIGLIMFNSTLGARLFSLYVVILMFITGIFQHMAHTSDYGFVALIGNIILVVTVGLFWLWEFIVNRNVFSTITVSKWKWALLPFALLAYWYPVNTEIHPEFTLRALFMNEAGLTYCMITPVLLTVLIWFYPKINIVTFRVTSFVALLFAIMNMITWFGMNAEMWWMGVVHIPLLVTSIIGVILGIKKR